MQRKCCHVSIICKLLQAIQKNKMEEYHSAVYEAFTTQIGIKFFVGLYQQFLFISFSLYMFPVILIVGMQCKQTRIKHRKSTHKCLSVLFLPFVRVCLHCILRRNCNSSSLASSCGSNHPRAIMNRKLGSPSNPSVLPAISSSLQNVPHKQLSEYEIMLY